MAWDSAEWFEHLEGLALAALVDFPVGVLLVDRAGLIRFVNRKLQFLSGYASPDLLGRSVELLVPEALREEHATVHRPGYVLDPRPRDAASDRILRLRRRDGKVVVVRVHLQPLIAPGNDLVVLAVVCLAELARELLGTGEE